jgi:hypothetical protein
MIPYGIPSMTTNIIFASILIGIIPRMTRGNIITPAANVNTKDSNSPSILLLIIIHQLAVPVVLYQAFLANALTADGYDAVSEVADVEYR